MLRLLSGVRAFSAEDTDTEGGENALDVAVEIVSEHGILIFLIFSQTPRITRA